MTGTEEIHARTDHRNAARGRVSAFARKEGRCDLSVRGRIGAELLPLSAILIERWRIYYNTIRSHSALDYQPPAPQKILPGPARPPFAKL